MPRPYVTIEESDSGLGHLELCEPFDITNSYFIERDTVDHWCLMRLAGPVSNAMRGLLWERSKDEDWVRGASERLADLPDGGPERFFRQMWSTTERFLGRADVTVKQNAPCVPSSTPSGWLTQHHHVTACDASWCARSLSSTATARKPTSETTIRTPGDGGGRFPGPYPSRERTPSVPRPSWKEKTSAGKRVGGSLLRWSSKNPADGDHSVWQMPGLPNIPGPRRNSYGPSPTRSGSRPLT